MGIDVVKVRRRSELEASLWLSIAIMMRTDGWPEPATDYRFDGRERCCPHRLNAHRSPLTIKRGPFSWCSGCPDNHEFVPRRWRFDFAWPDRKLAVEVEGGAFVGGRHGRGKGFTADLEKYTQARLQGWDLIRVGPQQIESGEAITLIERALKGGGV